MQNKTMNILLFGMILILAVSCDVFMSSYGKDEGNVTIALENAGDLAKPAFSRAVLSPDLTAAFRYEFTFTGPGGQEFGRELAPGAPSLTVSVISGKWMIEASSYTPEGILAGTGSTTVTVSAGNNLVIVPMTVSDSYTAKAITEFSITDPVEAAGVVNEEDKTVTVTVPYGTAVTGMTTSIAHTGVSISPDNGTAANFTNPVTYTVTAADGSTQDYTVTVTVLGQGTVLFLEDETFTLTAGTISWLANTPVTVNAPAAYDSYQWYMDNALISGATNNSYTFNGGDYSPGAHTLSVRVIKNGQSYSKTLNFTISVN